MSFVPYDTCDCHTEAVGTVAVVSALVFGAASLLLWFADYVLDRRIAALRSSGNFVTVSFSNSGSDSEEEEEEEKEDSDSDGEGDEPEPTKSTPTPPPSVSDETEKESQ
jgi:hypothetical protein